MINMSTPSKKDIEALAELKRKLNPEVQITLTHDELVFLSDVFHNYKDCYRDCKSVIEDAMEFEKKLSVRTNGLYSPDPTYDWKQ